MRRAPDLLDPKVTVDVTLGLLASGSDTIAKEPLMVDDVTYGNGTPDDPWVLQTPSQTSSYTAWRDEAADPPALVVRVGTTTLAYHRRPSTTSPPCCAAAGDWVPLGNADEGKPVKDGSVEAWARSADNPVGWLLRAAQGLPRPLRQLRDTGARAARRGRAGARRAQQPGA